MSLVEALLEETRETGARWDQIRADHAKLQAEHQAKFAQHTQHNVSLKRLFCREGHFEEANEESAVDRADSPSVSPGANEHEKRVEADETVDNTHEGSDQSQLRACFLAVNVAVINQLNIILEEVFVEAFIAYSDISGNCDVNVVSTLSLLTG